MTVHPGDRKDPQPPPSPSPPPQEKQQQPNNINNKNTTTELSSQTRAPHDGVSDRYDRDIKRPPPTPHALSRNTETRQKGVTQTGTSPRPPAIRPLLLVSHGDPLGARTRRPRDECERLVTNPSLSVWPSRPVRGGQAAWAPGAPRSSLSPLNTPPPPPTPTPSCPPPLT